MTIKINYKQMRKICFRSKDSFNALGTVIKTPTGGKLIHIDNGSNVLAVAHLDSVQQKQTFRVTTDFRGDDVVHCPQLDDRLGVYVLLKVLPEMGIKVDVLLTDDEEIGNSTAQFFKTNKKYNWMFQFDRRLDDVVFYQYGSDKLVNEMRSHGFLTGYGSFSDICYLDHLGCEGFNVGCGYENEHSLTASANMRMLSAQISVFASFYKANKNRAFSYKPDLKKDAWSRYSYTKNSIANYNNSYYSKYDKYYDEELGITWGKDSKKKGVDVSNKNAYLGDYWYHTYEQNGELVSDHNFTQEEIEFLMDNQYVGDDFIDDMPSEEYYWGGIDNFWDARENDQWYIDSLKRNKNKN